MRSLKNAHRKEENDMADLDIRIAGSGGQGVILCSIIIADAALEKGSFSAQSQSYGPEARGGTCKAEVVISDNPIDFPKVENSDFLLAMTQPALEKYIGLAKKGSTIMYDDSLTPPENPDLKFVAAPIISTARDVIKKPMVANIVAAAVINNYLGIADMETLEIATLRNVPKGTEDINRFALLEGSRIVLG